MKYVDFFLTEKVSDDNLLGTKVDQLMNIVVSDFLIGFIMGKLANAKRVRLIYESTLEITS